MAVEKFLDAGTTHILARDSDLLYLDPRLFPARVIPHDYGWWINVPEEKILEEYIPLMFDAGFSLAFVKLMRQACNLGCWWINLDIDGDVLEDLESFDGL